MVTKVGRKINGGKLGHPRGDGNDFLLSINTNVEKNEIDLVVSPLMIMQCNPTENSLPISSFKAYYLIPTFLASPSIQFQFQFQFHHMNVSPHPAAGFMDFGFLESGRKTRNSWSFGSEIEFQPQTCVEDGVEICSPPLWNKTESIQNEISPLLRHDHHRFSHSSRASQLEKTADARRELMEMVTNMSESTHELSLKDIVDEQQHASQEVPEEGSIKERSTSFNSEIQLLQQKSKTKWKNIKSSQITRSASMEKEVFQLKMFFPTSLGLKRKSAAGHASKVSQKPLSDNPENNVDKGWRRRILNAGQSKNSGIHSIRSNSGSSDSSSKSRYFFNSLDENLPLIIKDN